MCVVITVSLNRNTRWFPHWLEGPACVGPSIYVTRVLERLLKHFPDHANVQGTVVTLLPDRVENMTGTPPN